ncbi:MAG: GNAT family N-acetyltransferase [Chloroflexota bacterium]
MATIRQATKKDIPRILELYKQLSFSPEEHRKPPVEDCCEILEGMKKVPGYELLVAEENGEVIGTTVLAILPGFAHGTSPFAVVEYVVVDEKRRSRGIGKLLMEYVIARAKEAGCYKIALTSDNRREQAHKFYNSIGFKSSSHGFRLYL